MHDAKDDNCMVLFLNCAKESMTCQNLELFSDPLPSLQESWLKLCTLHLVQKPTSI